MGRGLVAQVGVFRMEAAVAIWMMTGMTKAEERCGHCCSAKVVATINIEMVNRGLRCT